ncbi:MAG: XylR family transcriptional regulator [Pirellulales bacterium]
MRRVGLIIDINFAKQHHVGIVAGVRRYAQEQEHWDCIFSPQLCETLRIPGTRSRYDGIITRVTPKWARLIKKARVPLVNVRLQTTASDVLTVAPDRRAAGRMAAEHFLARGFRHFGYLGFRNDKNSRQQCAGYWDTLQNAGWDCDIRLTNVTYDEESRKWQRFLDETNRWITSWPRPIGILAGSDFLCRYVADLCFRNGLDIPLDVALIGIQNEPMVCVEPAPSLTSVDLGYDRVGYEAARLLESLMDGRKPPSKMITLPPKGLIARQSTDVFAVEDPLVVQAMRFMSEKGHTGIDVATVAEAAATTRRTLERRFRAVLGRTIAEELTRLKIERVKRLLVDTDIAIKTLALECGFVDGKQMSKTFTRVVGIPPTEYRHRSLLK